MKIIQVIKKVNATEVGKTGTNETYISVPKDCEVIDIFEQNEKVIEFKYKKDLSKTYNIRLQEGREIRIVGLGPFYRDNFVVAGARVILEKRTFNNKSEYFIDYTNDYGSFYLQHRNNDGFTLLTDTNNKLIVLEKVFYQGVTGKLEVKFREAKKKRKDSKTVTNYYDVFFEGKKLNDAFKNNEIIEVFKNKGKYWLLRELLFQKIVMEV